MARDQAPQDLRAVSEAWSSVARGYHEYWSPRFRPLLVRAVEAFEPPPLGPLAVPGCGPGDEVLLLLEKFPLRTIVATDPSAEMVSFCRGAIRKAGAATALCTLGRAEDLSSTVHQAAGVFSSFTLQLLSDPSAALIDWSTALRLGGIATAIFWPRPSPESSFGLLASAIKKVAGEERPDWEPGALASLEKAGLALRRDERVHTTFEHGSPGELFGAIVDKGPLRALLDRRGSGVVDAVRAEWLRSLGTRAATRPWKDPVEARLWVLEKVAEPEGEAH